MTDKSKVIKVLGIVASLIGVGASLVSDWVNERKMEEEIDKKVNEAMARREEES